MNKLERYLDNLKEPALKQALRFILDHNDICKSIDNIGFIKLQIDYFAIMYPELEEEDANNKKVL